MSLPPQVNTDKSGKHRNAAMKESVQHSGEVYYSMGPPALEVTQTDSASSSGVYNPDKGLQSLPHYQQAAPVKWMHQEPVQAPGWSQENPQSAWGQNFGPYMSGVNARGQMPFHKGVHEGGSLSIGGENQLPANVEAYRDAGQPQGRGLEWEHHAMAAMHQAQLQAFQHAHKGVDLQGQPNVPSHTLQGSMSQPYQTMFRPSKQFSPGYYSFFPGNKGVRNMSYSEQPKSQQQLLHQMQQQQQQIHHQQQHQQQQQLHQHQLQLQQQIQQQQHHQMQQQYHQQQLQERQKHFQQMQQLQKQNVPQQDPAQLQVQAKPQQSQNYVNYQPPDPAPPVTMPVKADVQSLETRQEADAQMCDASSVSKPCPEKFLVHPTEPSDAPLGVPRRSRRLSREGQSPLGPPSTNIWSQESKETSQNGAQSQAETGGVIQITSRRRRASKEINLETLAQQASKMEPAKLTKVYIKKTNNNDTFICPLHFFKLKYPRMVKIPNS